MRTVLCTIVVLCHCMAFAQVIRYDDNVAKLPPAVEDTLKVMMKTAGVTQIVITDGSRSLADQVGAMYNYIKRHGVSNTLDMYGAEGDAVVNACSKALDEGMDVIAIKAAMMEELRRQLPSAIARNTLMHVSREDQFVVFDISKRRLMPNDKLAAFETIARSYQEAKKIHRFLGTGAGEKDALHLEFRK